MSANKLSRRALRELSFKLLFRAEFYPLDKLEEQFELFCTEVKGAGENDLEYLKTKFLSIVQKIDEIDDAINHASKGWTTSRMGKSELTILRLAYYEIAYEDDIPGAVSINEAVELAKKFGTDEAPGFVNGVLSNFVK